MLTHALLVSAAFLCSLVAGFLFAFAVVVMPGIGKLDDGAFIRAFQAIDRIIQDNQPLFLFVWLGSAVALIAAAVIGLRALHGADRLLVIGAALAYILCVQLPTFRINVPLNTALQKVDPGAMSEAARRRAREDFESRWNRWNVFRTACASGVTVVLLIVLAEA